MGLRSWLLSLASARVAVPGLAGRRERREAGRKRRHNTGGAAWTDQDRHPGPTGDRTVADVAPGTPGHFGSVRTTRRD
jgi:hypothetical protein